MIYLTSLAAGIAGSLLAMIVTVVIQVIVFARGGAGLDQGSGSIGFVMVSLSLFPVVVAGAAGFALGFWWPFRKRSRGALDRRERS